MSDRKPPRDWLLARHEPVIPRLDAIRRTALPPAAFTGREFIRELFHPHRTVWSGLAAVWIALAVFQFAFNRAPQPRLTEPPPPEAIAAWLAQLKSNEAFAQITRHP